MKKFILILIFLLGFSCAFADDKSMNNQNYAAQKINHKEASEIIWDREMEQSLYENYGSEVSPAFLNREGTSTDDGYGSDNYDSTGDYD